MVSGGWIARQGPRFCIAVLVLAVAAGCMKPRGGGQRSAPDNSGPIQGIAWDRKATMPALSYDEGLSLNAYWARFVEAGPQLEIGRAPGEQPQITMKMGGTADSFSWDSTIEAYRLTESGALGGGYSVFNGLTPGNQRKEPYGLLAFADADGGEALYGMLGKAEPATANGIEHFNGGYLMSRRKGDNAVPIFAGKAQARLDGDNRPQRLALLLTVPPELPRLFGSRIGAIQLVARYDAASLSFRAERQEVAAVGPQGRLRILTFSLIGQMMNRGQSLAGLFRLYDANGEALVIGAFTLQTTARPGPQTSQR